MKRIKNVKGITLIALVITIVVLIILAAVAVNLTLGDNGIFRRAKTAKEMYQNAEAQEKFDIAKASNEIDSYVDSNRSYTESELQQKIREALAIRNVTDDYTITYNEEYIDTSHTNSFIRIYRSGNVIDLSYRLCIKKDIPNSDIVLFSGIPNAVGSNLSYFSSQGSSNSAMAPIRTWLKNNEIRLSWNINTIVYDETATSKTFITGGITYITNE